MDCDHLTAVQGRWEERWKRVVEHTDLLGGHVRGYVREGAAQMEPQGGIDCCSHTMLHVGAAGRSSEVGTGRGEVQTRMQVMRIERSWLVHELDSAYLLLLQLVRRWGVSVQLLTSCTTAEFQHNARR
jgi:hypothetical protein